MKAIRCLFVLLLIAGCRRPSNQDMDGGGERKVTGIIILEKGRNSLLRDDRPKTLPVGQKLALEVVASWAIPYVGDETAKATLSVSNATIGDIDADAVFTARKPDNITITALLRVSRGTSDVVLGPTDSPTAGQQVITMRDLYQLTIVERTLDTSRPIH